LTVPISHRVQPGDCIASIAYRYGFFPNTLWQHPENKALRELRKDPNVLAPGDVVHVPDKRVREETCAAGRSHRFKRKAVPERLELQLTREGEPRQDEPYVLEVDGAEVARGSADGDGRISASISPSARQARLLLTDGTEVIEISLGHLLPVDDLRGAQQRLQGLGLYRGPTHGELDDDTVAALVDFQVERELEPTGELDAATQGALLDAWSGR
jgi:putative peptidoglycan binding protein